MKTKLSPNISLGKPNHFSGWVLHNKQSLKIKLNKTYLIKTLLAENLLFNPQ
ncbi:hypothetical protein N404_06345 [Helicobacter pylori FD506]|nr:hypothetical protein N404_06345 [Helicobacter pylori FD506]